jgi:hypothetical protein
MIRIRANRKEGFRRCGIFHPHEAVDHPEERFSKDELAQLMTEPMLTVEFVEASESDFAGDDMAGEGGADKSARKNSSKRGRK